MSSNTIISVEGPIGIGKSTLGKSIKMHLENNGATDVIFKPEPFNQLMLEQFLSDQKKYAYAFQLHMLSRRQIDFALAQQHDSIDILDRSLCGDLCFAKLQHKYGNMSDDEMSIYQSVYDEFAPYRPDTVIFLDVSVTTAMRRITKRNRNGESAYDVDYIRDLHEMYERTITDQYDADSKVDLYRVDWNTDIELDDGLLSSSVMKQYFGFL